MFLVNAKCALLFFFMKQKIAYCHGCKSTALKNNSPPNQHRIRRAYKMDEGFNLVSTIKSRLTLLEFFTSSTDSTYR